MKWVTFMGNSRVICPEHVDSRLQECIRMWYQPAMGNLTLETDKKEELLKATHVFQHVWPVWLCQIVLVLDQDICWDQNSKANFSRTWVGHHPVDEHLIGLFMGVSRVSQHGGPQNHPSHWFLKHEKTIENQWAGVASFSETSIYVNLLPQFHSNFCFNHETWIPRCMMFYSQFNDMECVCPKIGHRIDGKICSQPWDGRTQKMLALKREDLRFLLK